MRHLKQTFILALLIFLASSFRSADIKERIVGKWFGDDKNEVGNFTFRDDGFVTMEIGGQIVGGEEFILNGKKAQMKYEIDTLSNPYSIDIAAILLDTKEEKRLLGIFEFIDETHLRIAFEFAQQKTRPTNYDDGVTLTKEP